MVFLFRIPTARCQLVCRSVIGLCMLVSRSTCLQSCASVLITFKSKFPRTFSIGNHLIFTQIRFFFSNLFTQSFGKMNSFYLLLLHSCSSRIMFNRVRVDTLACFQSYGITRCAFIMEGMVTVTFSLRPLSRWACFPFCS